MPVSDLLPYLSGGGGALFALAFGIALILGHKLVTNASHEEVIRGKDALIADKDRQIEALTLALARERERGDAGILAAQVTREVVQGIRKAVE